VDRAGDPIVKPRRRPHFVHVLSSLIFLCLIESVSLLPAMAVVIPLFLIANTLRVLDTQLLLIVVYLTFNVPFAAWMLRGFFDEIPVELEDAAMVNG